MKRRGSIFTYSVIHSAAETFKDKTPYVVALVEENCRIMLALIEGYTEHKKLKVGMEVSFLAEDDKGNPTYQFED